MTPSKLIWRALGLSLLVLSANACGGSALADAASPEGDSLGSDLEQKAAELEAELARLEAKQGETVASADSDDKSQDTELPGDSNMEDEAPEPEAASAKAPSSAPPPKEREVSARDRCKTACRALSSMERSAERICTLVSEEHEKCVWARGQVKNARKRVDQAGCDCE